MAESPKVGDVWRGAWSTRKVTGVFPVGHPFYPVGRVEFERVTESWQTLNGRGHGGAHRGATSDWVTMGAWLHWVSGGPVLVWPAGRLDPIDGIGPVE